MPVTCVTTTTNRHFVDQSPRLTKWLRSQRQKHQQSKETPGLWWTRKSFSSFAENWQLPSNSIIVWRLGFLLYSSYATSSFWIFFNSTVFTRKEDFSKWKKHLWKVFSFLKWRHAFVFCYSAPFWILLTALLMATSHVNETVSKIRREPFIWEVRVLGKTRTYKWYSSRLM